MQITIDLDLASIISATLSADRLQPIVDKAISDAFKDALSTATGYSSEFRKALTSQLSEAMPHGLSIEDAAKFQLILNRSVSERVSGANAKTIKIALDEAVKDAVPDAPARVKLTELLEAARESFHWQEPKAFYASCDRTDHGYTNLYLDRDQHCRDKYRASHHIGITDDGRVYSLKLDGFEVTPKRIPEYVNKFSGLLLSMYVGRTHVDVDIDTDEVRYLAQEKED